MSELRGTAIKLIEYVGGIQNISGVKHCMTRLRFTLKDESLVQEDKIQELDRVKGYVEAGGQIQIVLGTGVVNKVYKEVDKLLQDAGLENKIEKEGGTLLQKVSRLFGDIFIPIIPVIVASGVLMGVRTYLTSSGILVTDSGWFNIAAMLIDTAFAFLPALVGWSAAKKFGGNPVYGFLLGLMLISSQLPAGPAVGRGQAEPLMVSLFGLQFALKGYQGSVLVAVLAGWLVSKIEVLVQKIVPNVVDMIFTPILTLTFTLFVILFGLGPIVQLLEGGLVDLFRAVFMLPLGIGGFITGALQQVLVITGMHHGLWILDISFLEETGMNMYQPIRNAAVLGQGGATLAVALFIKNAQQKSNSLASTVGCFFGITEPAIFGTTLKLGMPFIFGMIGSGVGGWYARIVNLAAPGMGTAGIPGLLYYLDQGMVNYLISSTLTIVVAFVLTAIWLKKNENTLSI